MNPFKAYKRARKAFKVFRMVRNEQKRIKLEKEGVTMPIEDESVIVRKAKGAVKSSTVGLAGTLIALGAWVQANPAVWDAVPNSLKGWLVIAYGVGFVLTRSRTL